MPSNNVFDNAKYTVFKMRDKYPNGTVVIRNLPYCLVQLNGDTSYQAFWMSPSPEGPAGQSGSLAEAPSGQVLNIEVQYVTGVSPMHPEHDPNGTWRGVHQWADPTV